MGETKTKTKKNHLPGYGRKLFGMTGGTISFGAQSLLMGYMTFYLTDSVLMSAATVGMIIGASRIFDGVSDIIAGFIVNRTNTRWGKARPYSLFTLMMWAATVMVFSVPDWSTTGKIVYVLIMYNLSETVARTLMTAAGAVHTKRAFNSDEQLDIVGISGMVAGIVNMVIAILIPMLIGTVGQTKEGWTIIAIVFAIPSAVMGLMQFFLVPELDVKDVLAKKAEDRMPIKESVKLLFKNRFIFIYLLASFLRNIVQGMAMQTFYFKYVVGNIELLSIVSMVGILAIFIMPFIPTLTRKFGVRNFISLFLLISAIGHISILISPQSMIVLSISSMLVMLGGLPISMLGNVVTIQCMKYTEWKEGKVIDGIIASMNSVSLKVGMAVGAIIVGALLSFGGYDGRLDVQPVEALNMIKFLYIGLPAILTIGAAIGMRFFTLENLMPQIDAELEARRNHSVD